MSRYVLTKKLRRILEARSYNLKCKICECPLQDGLSEKECPKNRGPITREQAIKICRKFPECVSNTKVNIRNCGMMGDWIESKQQRGGRSKLYHAKCYDDSHYDLKDKPKLRGT